MLAEGLAKGMVGRGRLSTQRREWWEGYRMGSRANGTVELRERDERKRVTTLWKLAREKAMERSGIMERNGETEKIRRN